MVEPFTSHEPWSGAMLWEGLAADAHQVAQVMAEAAAAQVTWATRPATDRIQTLQAFADDVQQRSDELAELIARETGKALWDATGEARAVAAKVDISIRAWEERAEASRHGERVVRPLPLGVMVVLGPFNFPAHLPNGQIIPGLLAGNAVVFKPSEHTPAVGAWLVDRLHEAGVPKAVVALVQGGREVAEALVDDPHTAAVWLTGSRAAGEAIHRRLAGRPEVLLALELGGNNPLIAWDAEDREALVRTIIQSAFITSGQRCTCARRLIVPAGPVGEGVISAVVAALPRLRWGDPLSEPSVFGGCLINDLSAHRVLATQDSWQSAGGRLLVAAQRSADHPALVTPGIWDLTGCAVDDSECFGPLLQVYRADSLSTAIALANRTRYGLAAAVLTERDPVWEACRNQLRVGICNRNRATTGASGALPFGGVGWSGNHRAAGYRVIDACYDPVAELTSENLGEVKLPTGMRER